ncbi:MAG TPA: hypothetical protein PKC24_11910 [Cyclobacteriaceae bacterium]|nr:hypothetical protein [Cyclobacteriaceae bacterium]
MGNVVKKTSFEQEQKEKDEAFLKLSPEERLEAMLKVRMKMYKKGVDYSFKGKKVKVTRG